MKIMPLELNYKRQLKLCFTRSKLYYIHKKVSTRQDFIQSLISNIGHRPDIAVLHA